MEAKKYSSFEEIDMDLEILKIERKLNFQKIINKIEKTKDLLSLKNIKSNAFEYLTIALKGYYGKAFEWGLPIIIKWLKKTKRGFK